MDLPAVSDFCVVSAIAVFSVFLQQAFFFAPILILDTRRSQAGRADLCPCFKCQQPAGGCDSGVSPTEATRKRWRMPKFDIHAGVRTFIVRWLAPKLTLPAVKIAVIIVFVSGLCVGLYGTTQIKLGMNYMDYVPSDSDIVKVFDIEENQFTPLAPSVHVYVRNVDLNEVGITDKLITLADAFRHIPEAYSDGLVGSVDTLFERARAWITGGCQGVSTCPSESYASKIRSFLYESPSGSSFRSDVVWDGCARNGADCAGDGTKATAKLLRFKILLQPRTVGTDGSVNVKFMERIRAVNLNASMVSGVSSFVYHSNFLWYERFAAIPSVVILNMSLAASICCCVLMLFLERTMYVHL